MIINHKIREDHKIDETEIGSPYKVASTITMATV